MATEAKIADFVAVTGASTDEARSFLEMAGGVVEQAINLFMEMGEVGRAGGGNRPSPAVSQGDEDDVRAPIAAFNDQMIEGQAVKKRRLEAAMEADSMAMNSRMEFDRAHKDAHASSEAGGKNVMLNKLFAAPDYNEEYPYGAVLEQAAEEGKWVIVNVQSAELFESHRLNRDIWSDETITDLVLASFLFWQRDDQSTEGAQFCKYHNVSALPHICVIDPRTKRSMKSWDSRKWVDARTGGEFLSAFLDKHSMLTPMGAPPAPAPGGSSSTPAAASALPAGQPTAAAGAAVVAAATPPPAAPPAIGGGAVKQQNEAAAEAPKEPPAEMPEEPPADSQHLKVSFRIPAGQRVTRRFSPTDPVEQMFVVASALTKEPMRLVDLSTQFPKRALRDIEGGLQTPMKDAQVAGNMVLVTVRSGA